MNESRPERNSFNYSVGCAAGCLSCWCLQGVFWKLCHVLCLSNQQHGEPYVWKKRSQSFARGGMRLETWCSLALPALEVYRCTSLILRAFCISGRNRRTVSGIWVAKFSSNFHQVEIGMEEVNNERWRATGFVGEHFSLRSTFNVSPSKLQSDVQQSTAQLLKIVLYWIPFVPCDLKVCFPSNAIRCFTCSSVPFFVCGTERACARSSNSVM